jgi:hypothetical protein
MGREEGRYEPATLATDDKIKSVVPYQARLESVGRRYFAKQMYTRGAAPLTNLPFPAAASRSWRYFTKYFGVNVEEIKVMGR